MSRLGSPPLIVGLSYGVAGGRGCQRFIGTVGCVIELLLGPDDLARIRFARSPMHELMGSMRVGDHVERARMHRPWMHSVRGSVADLRLGLLQPLLAGSRYVPDFLTPPPDRMNTSFADDLDRVRSTAEHVVRAQLDVLRGSAPLPKALLALYEDPERHLGQLASEVQAYWRAAMEPIWSRLAGLLDAEIGYRADQLTSGGVARLLGNLHPEVEYAEDALRILWPTW